MSIMVERAIEDYIAHLKVGFSLCPDADRSKIERAFSLMEEIASYVNEEDVGEMERALLFLDFYPFLSICKCSSIASANLYPQDAETKALGSYEALKRISLPNHILNGILQLNELFRNVSDTGVYFTVHSRRFNLRAVDYFFLLVAYLYHDVGKSPHILHLFGNEEEYRKRDHAFASGEFLVYLRHELEEHRIQISDSLFSKIYLPVVNHHQKTTDPLSVILKYIDHKAREYELRGAGVSVSMEEFNPSTAEEEKKYESTPESTKEELDSTWAIPEKLLSAFIYGVTYGILPKRRRSGEKTFHTYVSFPPNVYVATAHAKYLVQYILKKAGITVPALNEMDEKTVARQLIRKARDLGYVKDPLFQRDLLSGWWYEVKLRNGKRLYFLGFPLHVGDATKADDHIANIRPLSKEEIEEWKAKR